MHELRPSGWGRVAAPILVFAELGAITIAYPQLLGNGKDTVQAVIGAMGAALLAALLVLKPLATAGGLGCGAPGGLFTPTLTIGVLFGGLLGDAWTHIWPGAAAGSYAMIVPLGLGITEATVVARILGAPSIYSAWLGQTPPAEPELAPSHGNRPLPRCRERDALKPQSG